jgi:hypothetical protein
VTLRRACTREIGKPPYTHRHDTICLFNFSFYSVQIPSR